MNIIRLNGADKRHGDKVLIIQNLTGQFGEFCGQTAYVWNKKLKAHACYPTTNVNTALNALNQMELDV